MNFAFLVNNYPPRTGGVELHVQALARELTREGHSVTVMTLGAEHGWRDDAGVSVLTLPERFRVADILGFPLPGTRRRLTKLLRERGIDIVSVHTRFFPMSFVGWRAARRAHIPVIHTEHGSDHVASDSAVIRLASRLVDWTLGRRVLRGADQVLGVSENVVGFVQRLAGVEAEVFYNAISGTNTGDGMAIVDRPDHLVFVGRIVPGKGWENFLSAVAELRGKGFSVSGEVLGDGSDMQKLRNSVSELGLNSTVEVRGQVPQSEVRSAMRGATLVNPTVLSEGFQTTLLEALAERGRIVTYPVPGADVLARQGAPVLITAAATLGDLTSELEQLLKSPPEPVASDFVESWAWPARSRQFLRVSESVRFGR